MASALVLLPASFAAADDLLKDSTGSEISAQPDGDNYQMTVTNRRFETDIFAVALDASKTLPGVSADGILDQVLLIEQTHVSKEGPTIDTEPVSAKVKVTAYTLSKQGKGPVRFTIEGDGDEVKADGPYLAIKRWGCCADQETNTVYSLETGAYLFNATGGKGQFGDWATLGAKGGGWGTSRIVSYHAAPTLADDTVLAGAPNAAVVINYASPTQAIQRILVTVPKKLIDDGATVDWLPKLTLVAKSQPKGDTSYYAQEGGAPEKAYDGVTVRLALDDKTVITIPIKGDQLDIAHAKLPKGYALKDMPVKDAANP
ncbi:MAG TPA: hypothetical protein VGM59_05800 [Dongiaceae bacterium]